MSEANGNSEKENKITIKQYKNLVNIWKKHIDDFVNSQIEILENYKKHYLNERAGLIETRDAKKDFNIFTAFAEHYYHENFQSDILAMILNPKTKTIGNTGYLKTFLEFIGLSETEIKKCFPKLSKVEVLREEHRIDILIKNKKNAIIIESKLNKHHDEPNQLARYYKTLTEDDGLNVVKIVYLTLVPNKKPDIYSYDDEYKKYNKGIEKRLVCVSAVSNSDKYKLISFLDEAIKVTDKNSELSRVFISQYKNLLEAIGGDIMALEPEKKLIEKIFSSKEEIKNATDFAEVWEKKDELLQQVFTEKFCDEHEDWKLYDEHVHCRKKLNKNIFLYYGEIYQIGFYAKKFNTGEKDKLKTVLKELDVPTLTFNGNVKTDSEYVYRDFDYNNEPIDDYLKKIEQALEQVEEKCKVLLN